MSRTSDKDSASAEEGTDLEHDTGAHPSQAEKWSRQQEGFDGDELGRKFRVHKFDSNLTERQRELVERLEAIGYLDGSTEASDVQNVTIHDRDRAFSGFNLFTSGHASEAILIDMAGNVLHKWCYDFFRVWPDYPLPKDNPKASPGTNHWFRVFLLENGDLIAIYPGFGIIKLDKNSTLIWANSNRAHHDVEVAPSGDIYVLTQEIRFVPQIHRRRPILDDFVTVLDADGEEKKRVSLLGCFQNSDRFGSIWASNQHRAGDIFHTNSVEILNGRISDRAPAFEKGNVLVSIRHLNAIAVVDLEREQVVWAHTGCYREQHDAKIVRSGHLILFDNIGLPGQSRVLEYDPATMKMTWAYQGSTEQPFYSEGCGTCQRLPNGNTLITESDKGRAFEVTPDKVIVWEFYNPHRVGRNAKKIATLFEMLRLPSDFPVGWAQCAPQDM